MAEYLIQGETLTNIGDQIRVLSGTEEAMTPAEMVGDLTDANSEVTSQADLIIQIQSALQGKAGGSGDSSDNIEAATITLNSPNAYNNYPVYYVDTTGVQSSTHSASPFTCVVPSIMVLHDATCNVSCSGNVSVLINESLSVFAVTGDGTITLTSDGGASD